MAPFRRLSREPTDIHDTVQPGGYAYLCWILVAVPSFILVLTILRRMSKSKLAHRLRSHHSLHSSQCGSHIGAVGSGSRRSAVPSSAHRRRPANESTILLPTKVVTRDIELQVSTVSGHQIAVMIDILSPGEVLRRRVTLALGIEPSSLQLPSGTALDLSKSLNTQGLKSHDLLLAVFPDGVEPVRKGNGALERKVVEIKRFAYSPHTSEVSPQQDSFEISISARQEPNAMREAEDSNVRVEFTETSFSVSIRGHQEDYVLRRKIGEQRAIKGDILPVGFANLCPARCSHTLAPKQKLTVVLRPYPENWLRAGVRVKLSGLREACELNDCHGSITDFFEGGGKFLPSRYGVKLDNGLLRKIRRENIQQLSVASDTKVASGGITHQPAIAATVHANEKEVSIRNEGTIDHNVVELSNQICEPESKVEASTSLVMRDALKELSAGGDAAGGSGSAVKTKSPTTDEVDAQIDELLGITSAGDIAGGHHATIGSDLIAKKSGGALAWSKCAVDEEHRLGLLVGCLSSADHTFSTC